MGIETIDVEKRNEDWMAYLNGDRGLWGCGRSASEAVGEAVLAHYSLLSRVTVPAGTLPLRKRKGRGK